MKLQKKLYEKCQFKHSPNIAFKLNANSNALVFINIPQKILESKD
jgi:hypothetical protein